MSKVVLHVFGRMDRGGAELRTLSLMPLMQTAGIRFEFLTLSAVPGSLDDEIRSRGGQVHACPIGSRFPLRFWRLIRSLNPHAVHSHVSYVSGPLLLIAALAGARQRICHFRNTDDVQHVGLIRRARNSLFRALLRIIATDVVAVGQGVMQARWGGAWRSDARCSVIYNGFDAALAVDRRRQRFWNTVINGYDGSEVIIHVGRMAQQKNHMFVAEIFCRYVEKHDSGHIVFVGREDDTVKSRLVAFLRAKGVLHRATFCGEIDDVLPPLGNARCMLFPSLWEGVPGAVVESIMVGTPVVASNLPGSREISERLEGVSLVALGEDIDRWVESIENGIASDSDSKRARRIAAFHRSEFSVDLCAAKFVHLYGGTGGRS